MTTQFGKAQWVEMFRAAGLDDAGMDRWHHVFEQRFPEAHQRFLEWLDLPPNEVKDVRSASRTTKR